MVLNRFRPLPLSVACCGISPFLLSFLTPFIFPALFLFGPPKSKWPALGNSESEAGRGPPPAYRNKATANFVGAKAVGFSQTALCLTLILSGWAGTMTQGLQLARA